MSKLFGLSHCLNNALHSPRQGKHGFVSNFTVSTSEIAWSLYKSPVHHSLCLQQCTVQ